MKKKALSILIVLVFTFYNMTIINAEGGGVVNNDFIVDTPSVSEKGPKGYTVTARINLYANITRVAFATWTTKNGQDDVKWYDGEINGNYVTFRMDIQDHNYEDGEYNTHIYVYNEDEVIDISGIQPITITKSYPSITNARVVEKTAIGYTIEADIISDYGFDRIAFPTWTTKDGQDDVKWYNGTIYGNKVSFHVDIQDHNNESGEYNTHIYGYDNAGQLALSGVQPVTIDKTYSTINNARVTEKTVTGYTIEADISSDYGFERIAFPTWTTKDGQDDVKWYDGVIEGNKVTFHVDIKNHNFEFGEYNTHIYGYDRLGQIAIAGIQPVIIDKTYPIITNARVTEKTATGYKIEADINSDYGFERISFPTWTTKDGQDDVKWYNGTIDGNKVTFHVNIQDHNYESGEYNTHIYGYDKIGQLALAGIQPVVIEKTLPAITNVNVIEKTTKGYTIEADISSDYGFSRIAFPTWTTKNGQDDVKWYDGIINGNKVIIHVDIQSHNYESGEYNTHIYGYDKAGQLVISGIQPIFLRNEIPTISNAKVSDVSSWGYTVTADVSDDIGIERVSFPTWTTRNGQDDVKWYDGMIEGNKVTFHVDVKDHDYEEGEYITHIYAFDKGGDFSLYILPSVNIKINSLSGWTYRNGTKLLFNRDGKIVAGAKKLIIDISEHNGNVDWEQVRNSGVDAVILRCGYGWSENLNDQIDKKFIRNALELERLGIPYGVYLFSYENSVNGAIKEAEYTLNLIKGRKISLPVYYDLEYDKYVGDVSPSTYTQMAQAFCQKIEQNGYAAGIYANLNYWNTKLYDSSLDRYTKWVAQYNTNDGQAGHCDYTKQYDIWQYTSVGQVPGINGNVDMNAGFF